MEGVARRIRERLAGRLSSKIPVTVSIGFAAVDGGETLSATWDRADAALNRAKRGGRDRAMAAPSGVSGAQLEP
jgi:GGDEF domain-containing protein